MKIKPWIEAAGPPAVATGVSTFLVRVTDAASSTATATLSITIDTTTPSDSAPSITSVGDASSLQPILTPGSLATAKGHFGAVSPRAVSSAPLPTSLEGLSLQFADGVKAPILYISGTQVDFQVPWELAGQAQSTLAVTLNGVTGAARTVSLAATAPGIFSVNGLGTGQGAILNSSFNLVNSSRPASAG